MADYITYLREMVGTSKVIMVAAGVIVQNERNEILMQLRPDNKLWGIPGGFMELDESVQDAARREVYEETGLRLGRLELLGIYSGKEQERILPHGDQISLVKLIFICNDFEGSLEESEESLQLRFYPTDALPTPLDPNQIIELNDFLSAAKRPVIK